MHEAATHRGNCMDMKSVELFLSKFALSVQLHCVRGDMLLEVLRACTQCKPAFSTNLQDVSFKWREHSGHDTQALLDVHSPLNASGAGSVQAQTGHASRSPARRIRISTRQLSVRRLISPHWSRHTYSRRQPSTKSEFRMQDRPKHRWPHLKAQQRAHQQLEFHSAPERVKAGSRL